MTIHPDSLKVQMEKAHMTITSLAAKSRISAKQISRLLKSETPSRSNAATIEKLCKALDTDAATLAAPPSEAARRETDDVLRRDGYRRVGAVVRGQVALQFDLVEARYGVPARAVIAAAPLLFGILAEMSLKARSRKLEAWAAAHDAAEAIAPRHLFTASNHMNEVHDAEAESIAMHDIFGDKIENYTDRVGGDVFVAYLADLIHAEGIDLVKDLGGQADSLDGEILSDDLKAITGGDRWALFALERGLVRLRDIPNDRHGDARKEERAKWLADHVPAEVRAAHEAWLASSESDMDMFAPPSLGEGA